MPARRAVTETATSNSKTVKPNENDFFSGISQEVKAENLIRQGERIFKGL
jgi:hypothetical protein